MPASSSESSARPTESICGGSFATLQNAALLMSRKRRPLPGPSGTAPPIFRPLPDPPGRPRAPRRRRRQETTWRTRRASGTRPTSRAAPPRTTSTPRASRPSPAPSRSRPPPPGPKLPPDRRCVQQDGAGAPSEGRRTGGWRGGAEEAALWRQPTSELRRDGGRASDSAGASDGAGAGRRVGEGRGRGASRAAAAV